MKTKLDFYHMTPFYELNYFIAFIVKLYKRIQQRRDCLLYTSPSPRD